MREHSCNRYFIFDNPRKYGFIFFIKYFCACFYNIFCHAILFLCKKPKPITHKYKVTICAIFKNEASFMREWIIYHQLIGIDHFYLYNNFSADNYEIVLNEFINKGVVTLIDWPLSQGQVEAYKHWYNNYRTDSEWVSFLDLDEFVCPYYEINVSDWLTKYTKYPVVGIYWKMFGTSGKLQHDFTSLVTEQYTVSWDKLDNIGKLFYNTKFDIRSFSKGMMHSFFATVRLAGISFSLPPINEFKCFFNPYSINFVKGDFTIQINHYWSKAFSAYEDKHKRGDAVYLQSPRDLNYFLFHERNNRCSDFKIYRFLISLKLNFAIENE